MIEILRTVPIFSTMKDEDLENINRISILKRFPKDHIILLEKEEGNTLFIIINGKVKVTSFTEKGREVILSILGDRDIFGELSLLDGKPRSASVVAIENSELRLIRRNDFLSLLEKHPRITLKLLEELTTRLRKADERIESLALLDVSGRVAGIILQLAAEKGENSPEGVIVKARPTHQELANMVGTTRESVSRILKDLERKKYIALRSKDILIYDPARLKQDLYF